MAQAAGGPRRGREELARAAAQQKASETALQTDLIREQRTEKKARITKDLFEEEGADTKGKVMKRTVSEEKKQKAEGAEKKRAADDRPEDALRQVDGEEAAPDDEFDEKGVPIEPFNLRTEMVEGYFDKDGNYVRRRGGDGSPVRDAWLDEVDERLTNEGKSKALSNAKGGAKADDDAPVDLARMRRTILRLLRADVKGETSLTALRRLKQEGRMAEFNELTEAADACVQSGVYEIYSETVRQLYSSLQADEGAQQVWEYRATAGNTDEELKVHGPFTSAQMSDWHAAGYFQGDTVMLVRRKGSPTFRRSDQLDFDRLLLPKESQGQGHGHAS